MIQNVGPKNRSATNSQKPVNMHGTGGGAHTTLAQFSGALGTIQRLFADRGGVCNRVAAFASYECAYWHRLSYNKVHVGQKWIGPDREGREVAPLDRHLHS